MYTSYIGKKFLKLYREKEKKPHDYSAKQFFDEVFFPLFFDDEKHLMHVHGSTFFQAIGGKSLESGEKESIIRLNRLRDDIKNNRISGSTYVGYAAGDITATTSGQMSDLGYSVNEEEIYSSWIGQALGVGLESGFTTLFQEDIIMYSVFEGWKYYRQYLKQTPNVKDKQIETWNGQWLCHVFGGDFNKDRPGDLFVETTEVQGNIAIPTKAWSIVVFALTKQFQGKITAYVYNLSRTNTTLGFINIYLPEIQYLYELKDKLFLDKSEVVLNRKQISELETFYNFKSACKMGTIGLKAIEPRGLREFMPKGSIDFAQGKEFKFSDENSKYIFSLYKLWIIAMLNKTELLQVADSTALALIEYANKKLDDNRGKKDKEQDVKKIIEAKNFKEFAEYIKIILDSSNSLIVQDIVQKAYVEIASDNFPLFLTLVRFQYEVQKVKS